MYSLGHSRPPRRLRRGRSGWRRLAWTLALALLLALAGAGWALWRSIPPAEDSAAIPGLSAPVAITLDQHGVPRIRAQTERDAFAALGWLHARDRLFQMELMRRSAAGRLAEIAGPALVRNDRLMRTLGLARRAEADLAALDPDTRAALEAYASGVNAWIDREGRFAAPEFLALGQPEPWLPMHSLLWGKVMGLWLSGNFRDELARAALPAGAEAALWPASTDPGRPDWPFAGAPPAPPAPEPAPAAEPTPEPQAEPSREGALQPSREGALQPGREGALQPGREGALQPGREGALGPRQARRLAAALPAWPGAFTLPPSASNSWVVAGSRTASGRPLLANDPHLGFSAPILWYLVRIDLPGGRMLAGASSPGVPLVVIGRNERLAWGFTNNGADVQDLFVERALDADRYATPEGPRPFGVAEEQILVRGAEPVAIRVRETRHGPVISDLEDMPQGRVLALAAANLAAEDTAPAGLLALNRAHSLAEARAAAARITSPVQNLAVAEAAGGIALYTTGRVPVRRAGDGSAPVAGEDGAHDWLGWAAPEALPATENPASGVLANGNNRTAPADFPVFMGRDWLGEWRFRRIGQRLEALERADAAGMAAVQMDPISLLAREMLGEGGLLRRLPRPEGAAAVALDLLLAWDGAMAASLPQPLIFNAWKRRFTELAQAAGGLAPAGDGRPRGWPAEFVSALGREPALAGPNAHALSARWCRGDCVALAGQALHEAVAALQESMGRDPVAWRWAEVHVARFDHPLLARVPVLGALGRLRAVTAGDGETVSRGGMRGGPGAAGYEHVHGAGLRLVADPGDSETTLAMIATGQSGHPLSRHWADLLAPWRDGETLRLTREPAAVTGRLLLTP